MKPGLLQDDQTGPVSDQEFLQLVFDGKIKPQTLVSHPVHTQSKWYMMEQIPLANTKYEEGVRYRRQQKEEQTRAKEEARRERRAAQDAQRQAAIEEAAEQQAQAAEQRANSPFARFIHDGQSEAVVAKLYNRVAEILTQSETIEYIAVQAKLVALFPHLRRDYEPPFYRLPSIVVGADGL